MAKKNVSTSKDDSELAKSRELLDFIAKALLDKKAFNVIGIKVDHLTTIADYFIIASAKSTSAVRAMHENVDMECKKTGHLLRRCDGVREGRWIAMDFGAVLVHIFLDETREFYQLERLWTDGANVIEFND